MTTISSSCVIIYPTTCHQCLIIFVTFFQPCHALTLLTHLVFIVTPSHQLFQRLEGDLTFVSSLLHKETKLAGAEKASLSILPTSDANLTKTNIDNATNVNSTRYLLSWDVRSPVPAFEFLVEHRENGKEVASQ